MAEIPVYLVLANETTGELDAELAAYWEIALGLYKDEIEKILRQEKITMNIVEKNIDAWMDDLGLKEKYKNEGLRKGQKRIVFRMRKQGYSIKEISEATDCSQAQIKKFLAEGEE